jgi:cytohesin
LIKAGKLAFSSFSPRHFALAGHAFQEIGQPVPKVGHFSAFEQAGFFSMSDYPLRQIEMNLAPETLGLIAGNRSLPLELARLARAAGVKKLIAVALAVLTWSSFAFCDEIHDAAKSGDLEKVKTLLKDNPELVNNKDTNGWTPLFLAARNDHADVVDLLLTNGADVNATNKSGMTALRVAVGGRHQDVAELLLAHGADINARENNGGTLLIGAAYNGHADMVKFLLDHGADVNARDNSWTPLLAAVFFNHKDIAAMLLAKNADVNATNNLGTSLDRAASRGLKDMLKLLLAYKADVNAKDHDGLTPLHKAASAGDNDSVELLLTNNADVNARDNYDETPMHLALVYHHDDTAELLRERGGVNMDDINTIENSIGDLAVVKILLKKNPDLINRRMRFGITPLALAADRGCKDVAEFLLDDNADVNAAADSAPFEGWTPLLFAVSRYYDSKNAEDAMVDQDIEYHAKTHGGPLSPIMSPDATFAGKKEVAELLLAHGAEVNVTANEFGHYGSTPLLIAAKNDDKEMVELLITNQADVNAKNNDGSTPLLIAAKYGDKEMLEMLLGDEADIHAKNQLGETALHLAAQNGNKDAVELLLTKGADVNAKTANSIAEWRDVFYVGWDIGGQTPLHNAAAGGHKDAVELLLAHGAEVNATNNYGWTPLHFAVDGGHTIAAELLRQHGGTNDMKPSPPLPPMHGPLP